MSSSMHAGAVVFAKDMVRVAKFYSELMSVPVVLSERDHIVLESPECRLTIHAIPRNIADAIVIAVPPQRRADSAVKLFFYVDSIAEARAKAAALGGALNPPKSEWTARGFRACDGHDPEGNVVQVREQAP
jgi:predicted enzyme related to lactoylglutathione lyase